MVPKVEGPWDIHYVDRLLAQLEAKAGLERPILVHAILETALGVTNLEEIAAASPRMQGMSFGPADLAASRRMKTTRVGGGHPGYRVDRGPRPDRSGRAARQRPAGPVALLDRAHGRRLHRRRRSSPSTARSATSRTSSAARRSSAPPSCSAASAPGRCTPSRSTSPRRSSRPTPTRSPSPRRSSRRSPTARGVHMIDGKMQDDATWKQCQVMVDLAELLAAQGPRAGRGLRDRRQGRFAADEVLRVRGPRDRQARRDPRHRLRLRDRRRRRRARSPSASAARS